MGSDMSLEEQKRRAARAALELVPEDRVLGVGTGSTTDAFIDLLATERLDAVPAAVASSEATAERLRSLGIRVVDLNEVETLALYVDGADEFDPRLRLIKGGGGALTREKIVAQAAETFLCIVDRSKRVESLGRFPLPVEVVEMARELVSRELRRLGGEPRLREGFATDNGNPILDVHGLSIDDPAALEAHVDAFPGVVSCGIFARRPADLVLMGTDDGVERIERAR